MTTSTPLRNGIGIEITDASPADLFHPKGAETCLQNLAQYGVVAFRDLFISDDDLIKFSRQLGELVVVATGEHERLEIQTISMNPETANRGLAPVRVANFLWHFDGAHDERPQKATLLSAIEIDDSGGGDTEFASTCSAYDAMSDTEKAELEGIEVLHSFATALERVYPDASEQQRAAWDRVAPRIHPLVWCHWSGRRSLLLGSTAREVVGMSMEEGTALLDRLLALVTQPEYVLHHSWRRGDLVIWDNTLVLHRATPFEPTSPRLLHRTTLAGEPPAA